MAQDLPQELVDLVLGEFRTDSILEKRFIARCGLICKNWLPSSRYRFFAEVDLNDRTIESFLEATGTSPFPVSTFIRSFGLSSGREDRSLDEIFRKRLGPLPQVKTLRVTMDDTVFALNSSFLATHFAPISILILRSCQLPLNAVLDAASSFPLLQTLTLDWVDLSIESFASVTYQFPPQFHKLNLDLLPHGVSHLQHPISTFFQAILCLDIIPVFSSLSVRGIYPEEHTALEKYLRRVGDRLHHLRFDAEFSRSFSGDAASPVGLQHSTGLRKLDLVSHYGGNMPGAALQILPHLRSSNLLVVKLIDTYGLAIVPHRWEDLDKGLADARFAHLSIVVQSASPAYASELPNCMPLAVARGVLRVVDE
ncbi:hypothetical protein C8R44DRAFT_879060 [Mycena epipterygia]|nr:hypothetical protein C8R44DRAFT_879060 [Mycena epipterygia]